MKLKMLKVKTNKTKCTSNWKHHHVEKIISSSEFEYSLQTMYPWKINSNDEKYKKNHLHSPLFIRAMLILKC